MSKLTRRRVGELARALFKLLMEHPDGLAAEQALNELAKQVQLTPYELEAIRGKPRYVKRLHFVTTNLKLAGWLTKQGRTRWVVTEEGKRAYLAYGDPMEFFRKSEESRFSKTYGGASRFAHQKATDEIRSYLQRLEPYVFQDLVADLLTAMGYYVAWKAKPGKDGGTDIIAWSDALGVRPPRIRVQVKRQTPKVDVAELRSFLAVLGEGDVGLYVATTSFTKDAQDAARSEQRRQVTLIDVERFIVLWIEHYPKLDDAARRRFPLQPIYFLAPGN